MWNRTANWWRSLSSQSGGLVGAGAGDPAVGAARLALSEQHATLHDAWQRIEAWLSVNAPRVHKGLGEPASEQSIVAVERELGFALPAEYRASLQIHDGERKDVGAIRGWRLNSLRDLIEEYRMMSQVLRSESFSKYADERNELGLRPGYWHPRWIPIASDRSANHYLMDLDPAPEGTLGQIFVFDHEQGPEQLEARSIGEWLLRYAEALEGGQVALQSGELRLR